MNERTLEEERTTARLGRFVPLAGVVFVALSLAGNLTIGPFPDSDTPISKLTSFYSAHHGQVGGGGMLLAWAAIFLAFFGAAVWARIRRTAHPLVAGAALVGTAVAAADQLSSASTYMTLGSIGGKHTVSAAALQAWHIGSSVGGIGGGVAILLLAVAAAGILARAFPRWLAWSALVIGILQLTPIGFLASLAFLLWALVASIVMVLRLPDEVPTPVHSGSTEPLPARG